MNGNKSIKVKALYVALFVLLCISFFCLIKPLRYVGDLSLKMHYKQSSNVQVYYRTPDIKTYSEENSIVNDFSNEDSSVTIKIKEHFCDLRVDFGSLKRNKVSIEELSIRDGDRYHVYSADELEKLIYKNEIVLNGISNVYKDGALLSFYTINEDPYIIILNNGLEDIIWYKLQKWIYLFLVIFFSFLVTFLIARYVRLRSIYNIIKATWKEKWLLISLARNDFKARYAASVLGAVWAFVQPICTILVFWFVFQFGFKNPPISNVPYFLWLSSGLVPWFFFSDAWNMASNAFVEYSYLVKKVVFRIEILPLVKILSALFVHLFFIVFVQVLFALYGVFPSFRNLWLIYYMFAMICLVVGLSYLTSTFLVFVRDLQPILTIILQFMMWLAPIMWSMSSFSEKVIRILKINPVVYVINGYRYAWTGDTSIIPSMEYSIYFWLCVVLINMVGISAFDKTKRHFADVL